MHQNPTGGPTAGRICSEEEQHPIPSRQSLVLLCPLWVCPVVRRPFPVGASTTRRPLQPEATAAVMTVTKWLKPSGATNVGSGSRLCQNSGCFVCVAGLWVWMICRDGFAVLSIGLAPGVSWAGFCRSEGRSGRIGAQIEADERTMPRVARMGLNRAALRAGLKRVFIGRVSSYRSTIGHKRLRAGTRKECQGRRWFHMQL